MLSLAVDYSRLDETEFSRSTMARVRALVVGAGALGSEVVKLLGLLGVGQITIVDYDIVEASNLTRSLLLRTDCAIGRNKAEALSERARQLFPDTTIEAIGAEIADVGLQRLARHNLLFGCVDNNLARLEMAYSAQRVGMSIVDGGLGGSDRAHGRVSIFRGGRSACFSCVLSSESRRELLSQLSSPSASCDRSDSVGAFSSTPTMASIIASMQVDFGLRTVSRGVNEAFTCEITLHPEPRLDRFRLQRNHACPLHCGSASLVPAPRRASETTVRDLLSSAGRMGGCAVALVLDWPLCVGAQCCACGERWSPMVRVSVLRRRPRCPQCGSSAITEKQVIRSVGPLSPWFDCTLAEIGIPEEHLYNIRVAE